LIGVHYTQTILEVNNILIYICKKATSISTHPTKTTIRIIIKVWKYSKRPDKPIKNTQKWP